MNRLLKIAQRIDAATERLGRLVYWLVLVMIGVGCWNVAGRYFGQAIGRNLSSNLLIESQWSLFDIGFLLGAAYTLKHNGHVRVDVLQSQWSEKRKALADLLGTCLFLIPFCVMVLLFSWDIILKSWQTWEMSPDPGGLPRYPIKTLILLSFVSLIIQGISEAIKNFAILTGRLQPSGADAPEPVLEADPTSEDRDS